MVTRVVVSVLLLPLLLGIVYLLPAVAVPVSIACICALAVYEALVPTGFVKERRVVGYSILLAVCTPFWVYWGSDPVVGRGAVLFYVLALFLEGMASQKRLKVEQLFLAGQPYQELNGGAVKHILRGIRTKSV